MTRSTTLLLALVTLFSLTAKSQDTTYVSPDAPFVRGIAPSMTWTLLSEHDGVREFAVIFASGDEVMSGISDFAAEQKIVSARFTAIGSLKDGSFCWYDPDRKLYKAINIHQQMELLTLIGDIALYQGKPVAHAHASVSTADGAGQGGHLLKGVTAQTVELFVTAYPTPLKKMLDKDTDLKLISANLK